MPNFSKILEERPNIKQQLLNVEDGKIYSLPRIEEMGLLQNPNLLFINKEWTQKAIDAGAVSGITSADLKDSLTLDSTQKDFTKLNTPGKQEAAYEYSAYSLPGKDGEVQPYNGDTMLYYEDGTFYIYYLKDGGYSYNHSIFLLDIFAKMQYNNTVDIFL